ncbi:DUF2877 domain-containing protein [Streptomyces sp. NPDC102437]|uniref:oxamate carbamoyltransferase subunit AllH family protein n=1 Tax=Streptomyces sp. NPDC102437 TaxID=3366175 RepID=UPI00382D9CF6
MRARPPAWATRTTASTFGFIGPSAKASREIASGEAVRMSRCSAVPQFSLTKSPSVSITSMSGDDFLTGPALLSALTGTRLRPFARTLAAVLGDRPGRTTLLSLTTLREALAGRVRDPWPAVLHALAATAGRSEAQVTETLRNPVRRALAIGHTSGTDTLSGLLTGLHLERNCEVRCEHHSSHQEEHLFRLGVADVHLHQGQHPGRGGPCLRGHGHRDEQRRAEQPRSPHDRARGRHQR